MSEQHELEIERLLAAPEDAGGVALADVPGLLTRLASAQLQLAGLQAVLLARLQTSATSRPDAGLGILTMEQVAERLGVPVAHARELGRRGELPTVRVGSKYVRVRESSLTAWLRQREEVGHVPARAYHPRPKGTEPTRAPVVPLRSHGSSR